MRSRTRRTTALLVSVTLLAALLVTLAPAVTRTPPAGAAVATNSDADYATVEYSDPWDFSNAADLSIIAPQKVTSYRIRNGVLDADVQAGGAFILAQTVAGTIPAGRTTALHPINAGNLRKVSFRMYANTQRFGGFFWYTCDHIIPQCQNGFPFMVQPGWHTYSFDIPNQNPKFGGPPWQGTIKGIRFVPAGGGDVHISLDWFRLVPTSGSTEPPTAVVPLPVVDSPTLAGGVDYATVARRDPWDMSQPSDIGATANMAYGFNGWLLNGLNVGGNRGDAFFTLPLAGPIDANRFHRLTFKVFYEGPPGLGAGPGGGMVARLIWETAGARGVWQDSEDIIVFPGWNNISVDLTTSPPWAITDPDKSARIGWAGQMITGVRFDPHEDIGERRFLVDDIRIAEDAAGYLGSYDIKFHDNAWRAGTTADIYVSTARGGFGGTRIAQGLPVNEGVNTFRWAPNPLPSGNQWVYVVLHRGAYLARVYATGPLRMTAAPSPIYGVNPFGAVDAVVPKLGHAVVRGWAIDANQLSPINVHVYVDGKPFTALVADDLRADIGRAVPGYGPAHGYQTSLKLPSGRHTVCVYGINAGPGASSLLGCKSVVLPSNPIGSLDSVKTTAGGITAKGWAIDPNTKAPISVHLYVQGGGVFSVVADDSRRDLIPLFDYGGAHGFTKTMPGSAGPHTVCAYGINRGAGSNSLLGCRTG